MTKPPEQIWAVFAEGSETPDGVPELFAACVQEELIALEEWYGSPVFPYIRADLVDAKDALIADLSEEIEDMEKEVNAPCPAPRMADEIDRLRKQLKATLDREAETHRRHDAKLDAKDARIVELEAKLTKAQNVLELLSTNVKCSWVKAVCLEAIEDIKGEKEE